MPSSKPSDGRAHCGAPGPTLRVVLDTCILKLATFPGDNHASALMFELARGGWIEAWVGPAILEEYAEVPSQLAPTSSITVNTAPGHFDRKRYRSVAVLRLANS